MEYHVSKDDNRFITSWETPHSIGVSIDFSNIAGDTQCCYSYWMRLPSGDYAVYRNWYYTYDYEGRGGDEEDGMFIQPDKPTFDECLDALFEWINKRIDAWNALP